MCAKVHKKHVKITPTMQKGAKNYLVASMAKSEPPVGDAKKEMLR